MDPGLCSSPQEDPNSSEETKMLSSAKAEPPPYQPSAGYPPQFGPGTPAAGYPPPCGPGTPAAGYPPPCGPGTPAAGYPPPVQHQPPSINIQPIINMQAMNVNNPGCTVRVFTPVPTYLRCSIFTMLCCFWPVGLAAVVYSCFTISANDAGNQELAAKYSRMTRILIGISIVLGIIVLAIIGATMNSNKSPRY